MRVLVTGAAGFIGHHLGNELTEAGHTVVGVDRRDGWYTNVRGDILDGAWFARVVDGIQPQVIVHAAAQVGRVRGEDDLRHTITTNALGSTTVANSARTVGARLLYVSSSEVYGDQGEWTCREGGPTVIPHNLYGISKRWGEEASFLYSDALQIVRLSMPYGPGLPAGRGRAAIVNFLDQASRGVEIPVHRGGERSWCWVGDTVRGIRLVIEEGEVWSPEETEAGVGVYNVGRDDDRRPMLEVARMCCRTVGAPASLIREVDPPPAQTVVKRLSTAKLRSLGWVPETELADGLNATWNAMYAEAVG